MPDKRPLNFDHEATLGELAGLGKNRRFDEVIDDEEFEDRATNGSSVHSRS
jgi:hypothetical protein